MSERWRGLRELAGECWEAMVRGPCVLLWKDLKGVAPPVLVEEEAAKAWNGAKR